MNILYISGMKNRGGTETATSRMISLMNDKGHKVFLASDRGPVLEDVRHKLYSHLEVDFYSNYKSYIHSIFKLIRFVNKNNIDVIHCQMARPLLATIFARAFSKKTLLVWHSRGLNASTYKTICPISSFFKIYAIGNSKKEAGKLVRHGYCVDLVSYTYNPLPKIEYKKRLINKEKVIINAREKINLISVSRLSKDRNVGFAITVLNMLVAQKYDVHLHIVGLGEEEAALKTLSNKLALDKKVTFYGQLDFEELSKVYNIADIALNTINLVGDDGAGVGNNNLEAGVFSLPCVTFDSCAVDEIIIDGETGFCVPVDSPDLFMKRCEELIVDCKLRQRLGESLHTHVLRLCGDESIYDSTMCVYLQRI